MGALHIYGTSAVGKVREINEDRFLIAGISENCGGVTLNLPDGAEVLEHPGLLVAIADGMGGHEAGEVASRMALQTLAEQFPHYMKPDMTAAEIQQQLNHLILAANEAIHRYAETTPAAADLGCTLVGVLLRGDKCFRFHAGDSRLYRFRDGFLQQLTQDHSFAGMMARYGIEEKDISRAIMNSLGGGPDMKCEPEVESNVSFGSGDVLLLCSDGLSEMVQIEAMEKVLREGMTLPERGEKLLELASENGGQDNITLVLIENF